MLACLLVCAYNCAVLLQKFKPSVETRHSAFVFWSHETVIMPAGYTIRLYSQQHCMWPVWGFLHLVYSAVRHENQDAPA